MFVTNWNSTTKIQKISEITNFFRHYFLSRTEVNSTHIYVCVFIIKRRLSEWRAAFFRFTLLYFNVSHRQKELYVPWKPLWG